MYAKNKYEHIHLKIKKSNLFKKVIFIKISQHKLKKFIYCLQNKHKKNVFFLPDHLHVKGRSNSEHSFIRSGPTLLFEIYLLEQKQCSFCAHPLKHIFTMFLTQAIYIFLNSNNSSLCQMTSFNKKLGLIFLGKKNSTVLALYVLNVLQDLKGNICFY